MNYIIGVIRGIYVIISLIGYGALNKYFVCRILFFIIPIGLSVKFAKLPVRIRTMLEVLGGSFVKFGQTLSMRRDIVGDDVSEELGKLCDKVKGCNYEVIQEMLCNQLGIQTIDEVFEEFEKECIAAASIAQIHKARLLSGNIVAVKLLRPNIAKKFAADIAIMKMIAVIGELLFKECKRLRLREVVHMFQDICNRELDLRMEASYASELKQNLINDAGIYIPKIEWEFVREKVLIMEWINGIPILEYEGDRAMLARRMAVLFFNQAYRDGFFHGDMHRGNVLYVPEQDTIVLVDFGIMGRLDKETRLNVAEILLGFLRKDYNYVAEVHFKAGYVDRSYTEFAAACRAIGEPIVGKNLSDISFGRLMSQLFKVTAQFQMRTQLKLLMLQKSTILLEGMCGELDKRANIWSVAEGWMSAWMKDNLVIRNRVCRKIVHLNDVLSYLPSIVERVDTVLIRMEQKYENSGYKNIIMIGIGLIGIPVLILCLSYKIFL